MAFMRQRADTRTERDVELYARLTKIAEDPRPDADYHRGA